MTRRPPEPRSCVYIGLASITLAAWSCSATHAPVAATPGPAATAPAPAVAIVPALASHCLVADTTAPTSDTLVTINAPMAAPGAEPIDCEHRSVSIGDVPVIVRATTAPNADLRTVLSKGFPTMGNRRPDVVVTRVPVVLAFAKTGPGYLISPLAWDVTYQLVAPGIDSLSKLPTDAERDALARTVVPADTRGAVAPFPWLKDAACGDPTRATGTIRPMIAYPAGDTIARLLAARVVALAAARPRPTWLPIAVTRPAASTLRVLAVRPDSIPIALMNGRVAAAVMPVTRDMQAHCGTPDGAPHPRRGIPLVDSRPDVIIRRGSGAAFFIDQAGAFWFTRR